MGVKIDTDSETLMVQHDIRFPAYFRPVADGVEIPLEDIESVSSENVRSSGWGTYKEHDGWAYYLMQNKDKCITIKLKKPLRLNVLGDKKTAVSAFIKYRKVVIEVDDKAKAKDFIEKELSMIPS